MAFIIDRWQAQLLMYYRYYFILKENKKRKIITNNLIVRENVLVSNILVLSLLPEMFLMTFL